MPLGSQLSAGGHWYGVPGYWRSAVSADGSVRWDGSRLSANGNGQAPECLETLDYQSLDANRKGSLTLRQVGDLTPVFLKGGLFGAVISTLLADTVGCLIALALTIVALPVTAALLIAESFSGSLSEEGRLTKVYENSGQRFVSIADTRVTATGTNIDRMVDGASHRLYFTHMFHRLINYERLGGE